MPEEEWVGVIAAARRFKGYRLATFARDEDRKMFFQPALQAIFPIAYLAKNALPLHDGILARASMKVA
jgi:hypothetical protein